MNEIKLIDLIDVIIKEMNDPWIDSKRADFTKEWMLKRLDISGESNEDIPNRIEMHRERKKEDNNLLTGEEIVKGEYLVYWCDGHTGSEIISEYDNLKEVEDFILDLHDNDFVNMILVFQDGRIKEWKVTGPPKTYEEIDKKMVDGIYHTRVRTIIHAKLEWIN